MTVRFVGNRRRNPFRGIRAPIASTSNECDVSIGKRLKTHQEPEESGVEDERQRNWWGVLGTPRIAFGRGATDALEGIVGRLGGRRAMVVTDATLRDLGFVDRVIQPLQRAGCDVHVFDAAEPEPSTELAQQVAVQSAAFRPEVWLALGGGSNMDLAKLAATLSAYDQSPESFFGFDTIPGPIPPLVCLPTTAGTGSEVSHAAVIKHAKTGQKGGIVSEYLRPMAAVVDPSFTDTSPRDLTAACGMDALTHAIEAVLAKPYDRFADDPHHGLAYEGSHPLGGMLAEQAIRYIGCHFNKVLSDGGDTEARDGMALASTLAGMAFSTCGVSLVHALEYWVGSKYRCPHGVGNAILLPAVLRFYLPACAAQIAAIGSWLGVPSEDDPMVGAEAAIASIERLRDEGGMPARLSDVGATATDLPGLARAAATLQRLIALAPRTPRRKDLVQILESVL